MRETRSYGSVRGVPGNGHLYRDQTFCIDCAYGISHLGDYLKPSGALKVTLHLHVSRHCFGTIRNT